MKYESHPWDRIAKESNASQVLDVACLCRGHGWFGYGTAGGERGSEAPLWHMGQASEPCFKPDLSWRTGRYGQPT
ncbi:MAG TPA: hypothetical protein VGR76_12780 [Candidatus Angelobacter sp.]|nr:hypothetical protein [Candidatus Angelobacter sp.]